jgi:hypothetical protein
VDVQVVGLGDLGEALPEVAGHRNDHPVARREQVGHRGLQPTGAGRGEHEHVGVGSHDPLDPLGDLAEQLAVGWAAVIDERASLG